MATCPKEGIYVAGFTLGQLGAQVDAALGLSLEQLETPDRAQGDVAASIASAREVAGKKFMWDGAVYVTRDDAKEALEAYKSDGPKSTCSWKRTGTWFIRVGRPSRYLPPLEPNRGQTAFLRKLGQGPAVQGYSADL
jgi:hypothetical protein